MTEDQEKAWERQVEQVRKHKEKCDYDEPMMMSILAAADELTRLRAIEAKFDALSGDNFIATLAAATAERDALRNSAEAMVKVCEAAKECTRQYFYDDDADYDDAEYENAMKELRAALKEFGK